MEIYIEGECEVPHKWLYDRGLNFSMYPVYSSFSKIVYVYNIFDDQYALMFKIAFSHLVVNYE